MQKIQKRVRITNKIQKMKRLKLEDFKLKNLKKEESTKTDQLLGQVLGDCHECNGSTLVPTLVLQGIAIAWEDVGS